MRVRVRVSCERDELVLMVVGPRWKNLDDLETPCPECPGLRPEYPGRVLQSFPLKEISSRDLMEVLICKGSVRVSYLDEFVTTPDIWI